MRAKWLALLMALLMMTMLVAACGEQDPEALAARVVVEVNGEQITRGEAEETYVWVVAQSITTASEQGTYIDPTDAAFISEAKTYTLNLLAGIAILRQKLAEYDASFTEEEMATFATQAREEFDLAKDEIMTEYGLTEEEAIAAINDMGYSLTALEFMIYSSALDARLYEVSTADIALTDQEVEAAYEDQVETARNYYGANPSQYISDCIYGNPIYYRPEGFRNIKNMVIAFPDEITQELSALNAEVSTAAYGRMNAETELAGAMDDLSDEERAQKEESLQTLTDEETRLREELIALMQRAMDESKEEIDKIYAEVTAEGADFDALLSEYSADTPTDYVLAHGYPVTEGTTFYVTEFVQESMAMEAVGDISEPFASIYGAHILLYFEAVTPGPVPLEDVRDTVAEGALTSKKESTYESSIAQWYNDAKVTVHSDRF